MGLKRKKGIFIVVGIVLAIAVFATLLPTIANYSDKELIKRTIEIALIKQEIPDYELLKRQGRIVLSTENLDPKIIPKLPGVDMIMLSSEEIQEKADREGNFLYLRFKKIDIGIINASVSLDNFWKRSKDSTKGYLSGGGFTLNFYNVLGIWIESPVRQSWIS